MWRSFLEIFNLIWWWNVDLEPSGPFQNLPRIYHLKMSQSFNLFRNILAKPYLRIMTNFIKNRKMLIEKYLVSSFYHRRRTRAITLLVKQHKLQNWNTGYLVSCTPIIKHQQLTLNRGHSIFNLPVTKLTQDHLQSIFQFVMQHCHKSQPCYTTPIYYIPRIIFNLYF